MEINWDESAGSEKGEHTIRYVIRIIDIGIVYYLIAGSLAGIVWFLTRKICKRKRIAFTVLLPYLFLVLCSTVFTRRVIANAHINMRPFWTMQAILTGGTEKAWLKKEIALNILMLMPVGLLAPMLMDKRKMLKTILIGLCISVSIECLQYATHRGLAEIDDVISNMLGVIIGCWIHWFITWQRHKGRERPAL